MLIAICFNLTVFSLFVVLCVKPIYLNFLDFNMDGVTPKKRLIVIMLNVLRCICQLSAFLSQKKKTFFIPGIFAAANYILWVVEPGFNIFILFLSAPLFFHVSFRLWILRPSSMHLYICFKEQAQDDIKRRTMLEPFPMNLVQCPTRWEMNNNI